MKLTKIQRENLKTLLYYLLKPRLKARFNMEKICDLGKDFDKICGAVGCAMGHGPYAGINKMRKEDFLTYTRRVFGVNYFDDTYLYIFSGDWGQYDNTNRGAARRILRYLSHDCTVPPGFTVPSKKFVL